MKRKIAIFASGSGTNAEAIINYFQNLEGVEISLILSNNPKAYVLQRAVNHKISQFVFTREMFYKEKIVDEVLESNGIDFIVLAGFMWLIPARSVLNFKKKMVNIHPALLPKYGGKGMYGSHVHEAVVANKEKESGITIHWVNAAYDEGDIIFQSKCPVNPSDTADDVANKIHQLAHIFYPRIIAKAISETY